MATHYALGYIPFLIAWDWNFLPDVDSKHEIDELPDNRAMILLASFTIPSNILIEYDRDSEYP